MYQGGVTEIVAYNPRTGQQFTSDDFAVCVFDVGGAVIASKMMRVSVTSVYRWMHGYGIPNYSESMRIVRFIARSRI
jgi:hypothetical protein